MPRPRARQGGLTLVTDLSAEPFQTFLAALAKKPKGCVEGLDELTRQQLTSLCAALDREVRAALCVAGILADDEMVKLSEPPCPDEGVFLSLLGAAVLGLELLTKCKQAPPEELLNAATMLHDYVLMAAVDPELGTLQLDLQDAVMRLCVAWWERQLPGKELLVAHTIPYTLLRAVNDVKGARSGTLVRTCYAIREALELLDWDDETIGYTKRLLLVATMHPAFLREPEGRRFVAGLFKLQPQMTQELVAIMRNQIASNHRTALEPYGEILFRAWRDTVGPCAATVEEELQGLMQAAILASTPQLAKALRTVLNGIHSHKGLERRVNPMLVRLYDPILPRSFGVANAQVRCNALNLLVAAFPVMDPDAPREENQARLTQQLGFLLGGLTDPHPDVREAAVAGCCHCLKLFWEIIPAATSAKIISDITCNLVFDQASKAVRLASLHGLCALTESQHAQPVLKKALPGVAQCILDKDAAVREAMADLLLSVSSCRPLQGVFPMEALLATLARDTNEAVARKISRVVVPSYFPSAEEGTARVGALLRSNPKAGVALCRNIVARFMSDGDGADTRRAPSYTASVPTEQILQLAGELVSQLLITAPQRRGLRVAAGAEGSGASPPPKRAKARRGDKGADGSGAAGKKRAKRNEAVVADEEADEVEVGETGPEKEEGAADNAAAAAPDDEDAVVETDTAEAVDTWVAVLEGLLVLMQGLGAAVDKSEECSPDDVDEVLPGDNLTRLFTLAEENVGGYHAPSLVLQLATAVYFTTAAQTVRDLLFERLVEGALPGLGNGASGDTMELDGHRGPTPGDVGLLTQTLQTLATGFNVPKLLAVLSAALGVREAQPIRKPVDKKKASSKRDAMSLALSGLGLDISGHGHDHGAEHQSKEAICSGCRLPQPADTMLICDGCEKACHIHCMRPELSGIPEGDWFCWDCEPQLQAVRLPPAAAARCLSLLLSIEDSREALLKHPDFGAMIKAMQQLAADEADSIALLAQGGPTEEADASSAPSGSDARCGDTKDAEGFSDKLLGDPWGTLGRYCRAALHRAMWTMRPQDPAEGDAEDGAATVGAKTPGSAGRRQRRQRSTATPARGQDGEAEDGVDAGDLARGFSDLIGGIDLAVQTVISLAELVMGEASLAAQVAALQYSQGLLRVLLTAHYVDLLALGPDYVGMVAYMCTILAALARAAAAGLTTDPDHHHGGGGAGSNQQKAAISAVLRDVLLLTKQMVAAVRMDTASGVGSGQAGGAVASATPGPSAPTNARQRRVSGIDARSRGSPVKDGEEEEEDELPSQQLEGRMDEAAGGSGQRRRSKGSAAGQEGTGEADELPPAVAVERLIVSLMTLMCDPALGSLLRNEVRASAADLVGELLSVTYKVEIGGWLDTLCRLTGNALVLDLTIADELRDVLRSHTNDNTGEAPTGKESDENGAGPGADGPEEPGAGGVRGLVRKPRGGGGRGGKKDAAVSKAQAATAEALAALLKKANPAVGIMSNILVRVCAARKVFGRAMLLLAGLVAQASSLPTAPAAAAIAAATESAGDQQPQPVDNDGENEVDEGSSALGAVVLLALCRVEASAAATVTAPPAGTRRTTGRCGALAQEAALKAAQKEAQAAVKALGVLRHSLEEGRVLQPLQEQHLGQRQREAAEGPKSGGDGEDQQSAGQARALAHDVAQVLVKGGVGVAN